MKVATSMEWIRDRFTVTCDSAKFDRAVIVRFLRSSYWATGIPVATVEKSIENSLCFALLEHERQVGFARVISDYATFAYLGDVFILPEHRSKGLAKWMMSCVISHPNLQGLRRWMLVTRDAHGLYEKVGFAPLKKAEMFMERHDADVYRADARSSTPPEESERPEPT